MEDINKILDTKRKAIETETARIEWLEEQKTKVYAELQRINDEYNKKHAEVLNRFNNIVASISSGYEYIESNKEFIEKNS